MSKALAEVVVLDLTTQFWASLGVALLGDFGARVIKVEELPDARQERLSDGCGLDGASWDYLFELANRNKLSVALNFGEERGREILGRLIGQADVFVTDYAFTRLEEQLWDYETLSRSRPELIYAAASGFGPEGPDRDQPALDELAAARTGMMPILPQPGQPPVYAGAGQMYSSVMLALGIATALAHRQRTGEGQRVDVSLFAGNMYGASLDVQAYLAILGERFLHPISRMDAGNPMSGPSYPTQDGRWITVTMPDTDRYWPVFAQAVGLDPADPRFDSHEKRCEVNRLELIRILDEAFRTQPAAQWRRVFIEGGLSGDVIEDYSYPTSDQEALANRYVLDLDDPSLGRIKTLGFPVFMSDTPARLERSAPCLGQHTAQLLHELLDYSEDGVAALAAAGAVR